MAEASYGRAGMPEERPAPRSGTGSVLRDPKQT